ncbi:Uma2 family endonuclease [Desulfococcaceae bacterium HSG8]|nr:Uma2 family endonuclease [Desulfococcaceae bacterium HSG8]
MEWPEICEDQHLRDLPYKIEQDKWGNIVMSPASNKHGRYQARLIRLIGKIREDGDIISECSVQTRKGTKVADVAWASDEFIKKHGYETPYSQCPELVVEIKSPSNTRKELEEKSDSYFAKGASEVWICDESGNIRFYKNGTETDCSELISKFAKKID